MSQRWLLVLLLSLPCLAGAAEDVLQLTPGPSCVLAWDYPPGVSLLASFSLWKRQEGESYPRLPTKMIPAMEALVTRVQCDAIAWAAPGVYYIVVRAQGITGELSDPSNELVVRWGRPEESQPPSQPPASPPLQPKPPRTFLPPPPPPLTVSPPVARTVPPSAPPGQGGWLSDTCQWQGNCPH